MISTSIVGVSTSEIFYSIYVFLILSIKDQNATSELDQNLGKLRNGGTHGNFSNIT